MKYLKQIIAASIAGMVCMTAYSDEVPVGAITGLYQEKTAVPNEDGESYKLTIDSYAVGSMVTEQTTTCLNADVVLVIDMSGSMKFPTTGTYSKWSNTQSKYELVEAGNRDTSEYYCVCVSDNYYPVDYRGTSGWQYYENTAKTPSWKSIESYKTYRCGYSAVLTAAEKFLINLKKDAVLSASLYGATVSHRVKILSFSDSKTSYDTWGDFYDVKEEYNTVISKLLSMNKFANGTYPASAIAGANSILTSTASTGDTKNVVFFTDGAINYTKDTNADEVGKAIHNAYSGKNNSTKKITYFSIGWSLPNTEWYLNCLNVISSNFPNADAATTKFDPTTLGTTSSPAGLAAESNRKDDFYMRNTDDPMELTQYFEAVAKAIAHAAKIYNLTEETQIRDYITSDFKIKDWKTATPTCVQIKCTGFDADNNPTFVGGDTTTITGLTINIPNDSVILIKGYDFKANVCGKDKTGKPYGNKLSIQFDIVPTATFKGGFNIKTNTPASGIYETDSVKADTIGTYPIPKVAAPVDLIVTASGLKDGESLLVYVTRDTVAGGDNRGKDGFKYELMLTGTQLEKQILKKVATKYKNYNDSATYYYFVDPQDTGRTKSKSWDWRYDKTSNAPSHPLWDDTKGLTNVFPFTRTERTGIQSSDEDWSTSKKTH